MTRAVPDDQRLSPVRYLGIGAILIPFFVIFLFPFAIMISTSLKTNKEVYRQPPTLAPDKVMWSNYGDVWSEASLTTFFRNSLIIGLGTAVLALILAIPAAYA